MSTISGTITRVESDLLTLRCPRPGSLAVGLRGVLAVPTEEGQKRGRVELTEVTDLTVRVRLLEPLALAERRVWPRADVVLRLMARRLRDGEAPGPRRGLLTLIPDEGRWHTEEVVLSGTGLRGCLGGGDWSPGERLELRLHVPGRRGGDHFVTTAEVIAIFDDESPAEQAVRFLDLPESARIRLGEIVDQARLSDLIEDAW